MCCTRVNYSVLKLRCCWHVRDINFGMILKHKHSWLRYIGVAAITFFLQVLKSVVISLTTCCNLKVIHLRRVINQQNTTIWSVRPDLSCCGFSCDCTITKCISINNATGMNHLHKIFSSCSAFGVPYSVFFFCLCLILSLYLAFSHDYVCMKVAVAIGLTSIPWMINDLGITGCVTATGENRNAVWKTCSPSATSHHTSRMYCSGKEPTPSKWEPAD
jgi:hypothetical protein